LLPELVRGQTTNARKEFVEGSDRKTEKNIEREKEEREK